MMAVGYPETGKNLPNALIFGTGEYTTGYTPGGGSKSDKSFGVVGIVHFDLRRRGLIGEKIGFCGTNGDKFDGIREHFEKIPYVDFPKEFTGYPAKGVRDPKAYFEVRSCLFVCCFLYFVSPGAKIAFFLWHAMAFYCESIGGGIRTVKISA